MFTTLDDGTFVDEEGRIILFSPQRYMNDIASGRCCLICGKPDDGKFTREHIIPDWIVRRFKLISCFVNTSNGSSISYKNYKTPCCQECNSMMGDVFEKPLSKILSEDPRSIAEHMKKGAHALIFVWMALIFFKLHHKDNWLRQNRDQRTPSENIASLHPWEDLYHIHVLIRSFYTRSDVSSNVLGSLFMLPAKSEMTTGNFDFADITQGRVIMIRLGEIAFVAVLDDTCSVLNIMKKRIERITAPLSELQLREFCAECGFLNVLIKERPEFISNVDLANGSHTIWAGIPERIDLLKPDPRIRGQFLYYILSDLLPNLTPKGMSEAEFRDAIVQGKLTFLFDDNDSFIENSVVPL
jgi:hypothetical protein